MEPMLAEIEDDNLGVKVVRLNIDENKQLALSLGVTEIPILKLFKGGKVVWVHHGLIEKHALTDAISNI
jgi:thioredoxin-like negative regulator of GroEL